MTANPLMSCVPICNAALTIVGNCDKIPCDKFCVAVIPAVAPLAGAWIEIEKTIVYNVLCDYIEGGHLIEQDGQAKRLGNRNAYGSPILEKTE